MSEDEGYRGGGKRSRRNSDSDSERVITGERKRTPFVLAAYEMVSFPDHAEAVGFTQDGLALEIRDVSLFSDQILPKYFKHKNMSSFIRQLNMYGFEKVADCAPGVAHTFKHPLFQRGREDLLDKIIRKSVGKHVALPSLGAPPGTGSSAAAALHDRISQHHGSAAAAVPTRSRRSSLSSDDDRPPVRSAPMLVVAPPKKVELKKVESKRMEAEQAVDDLTRLRKAQAEHESRIRMLEEENQHMTTENENMKATIAQVKEAQNAMTERLRRFFLLFMRYYVRDDAALESTIAGLLESSATTAGNGQGAATAAAALGGMGNVPMLTNDLRQHSVAESLRRLGSGESFNEMTSKMDDTVGLVKNHSLADVPISLPIKPSKMNTENEKYQTLARELSQHIDRQDETIRRIDTLTSGFADTDMLDFGDDDFGSGPPPSHSMDDGAAAAAASTHDDGTRLQRG